MRFLVAVCLSITLYGCTSYPLENESRTGSQKCSGSTELPAHLCGAFEPVDDPVLLGKSLGESGKGNLRDGRVYKSMKGSDVVVFRTWNNTHPGSKLGHWWTFEKPAGKISTYRSKYAICVEWSPIDMLVRCSLRPEQEIVVGTGQSAKCKHMTFPVSDARQVFIDDAVTALADCTVYDGEFSWK